MANLAIDSFDKLYVRNENIAAPTTFLDSSTANVKTITANGNAKQLPVKFNKSAGFFNGTSDYLSLAASSDFAPGTGAFDFEVFFQLTSLGVLRPFFDTRASAANTTGFNLHVNTSNQLTMNYGNNNAITGTTALVANTWYHVRLTGNGGGAGARNVKMYLDAVQEGSTWTSDYNFTDTAIIFCSILTGGTYFWAGWLKEMRWSNVVRTNAIPTIAYTSDSNTKLLLHFDTPASSPIAPAIAFDGTGDYLSLADSADWDLASASDPYTIEFSFMMTTVQTTTFISRNSNADWSVAYAAGTFSFYIGNAAIATNVFTPIANVWYHVAAVKESNAANKVHLFVRGVIGVDGTHNATVNTANVINIGRDTANTNLLIGNMREIQISTVARYTAAFTPSQTGFTVDSNTKLYIKGNESNGVTTFVDSETTPKTITTNGDTKIKYTEDYRSCIFLDSETTPKYPYPVGSAKVDFFAMSTGVGFFDGTNSYLSVPSSSDFNLNGGSWTVEGYVRPNNITTFTYIVGEASTLALTMETSGKLGIYLSSNASAWDITSGSLSAEALLKYTWYHFTLVFTSGVGYKLYVNGTLSQTIASATQLNNASIAFYIGGFLAGSYFASLLENVRIAKGVARYTATFNPPFDDIFNGYGNFFLVF